MCPSIVENAVVESPPVMGSNVGNQLAMDGHGGEIARDVASGSKRPRSHKIANGGSGARSQALNRDLNARPKRVEALR